MDLIRYYKFFSGVGVNTIDIQKQVSGFFDGGEWPRSGIIWGSQSFSLPLGLNYKNPEKHLDEISKEREGRFCDKLREYDLNYKIIRGGRQAGIYLVSWDECEFYSVLLKPSDEHPKFDPRLIELCESLGLSREVPIISDFYKNRVERSRSLLWAKDISKDDPRDFINNVGKR